MPTIYRYQKYTDTLRTVELHLPDLHGENVGTELATLDGFTYVCVPDEISLPKSQPAEIAQSIEAVQLSQVVKEEIKSVSPHCRLIQQRMTHKIRSAYSLDDEMYYARIGVGAANGMYQPTDSEWQELTVFGEFVESIRQWGRDERAKLGLGG